MKKILGVFGCIMMLVALSGCATSRSTVQPAIEAAANPDNGVPIKFATVRDLRVFELEPKRPDIPSLRDGEIANTELTVRAIGRKRNGFGKALGDVLLPEGETVANTVQASVANAFRNSGYRVLDPSEPDFEGAAPVTIEIRQCWSWINMGFWALTLSNRIEAEIRAPLPGIENGMTTKSEVSDTMVAIFEDDWSEIMAKGLADFQKKLENQLPHKVKN